MASRYYPTWWYCNVTLPPKNFRNDPAGHVGNQCGHLCIGLAAYALLGIYGGAGVALVAAAYFIIVEGLLQRLSLFWDSVEDTTYVTAGAGFLLAYEAGYAVPVVVVIALGLAFGVWLRR